MVLTPSKISIRRGKFTKCVNEGGVSSLGASTSHNSKGLETSDEDVNNADDDDGGDEGRVTDEARMKRMTLTGRTKERKEGRGVDSDWHLEGASASERTSGRMSGTPTIPLRRKKDH